MGSVTFYNGGTSLGTVPLSSGTASLALSSLRRSAYHNLTFDYSGDSNFAAIDDLASLAQTVSQDATTSAPTASPGSTIYGQNVTLTATVSAVAPGSGSPTGTVSFYDGTTVIGTAPLVAGSASFTDPSLSAATHSLSIQYSGDADFAGGSSPGISEVVTPDSTITTVAAPANPPVFGQAATLMATVVPGDPGPGSGNPTGTVTFYDGSSVLGSASLSSGTASISTCTLSVGAHSFSASFAPRTDPDFLASTSMTVAQTVSQASTTVTLSEPPTVTNPSVFGQQVTINAAVAAVPPVREHPAASWSSRMRNCPCDGEPGKRDRQFQYVRPRDRSTRNHGGIPGRQQFRREHVDDPQSDGEQYGNGRRFPSTSPRSAGHRNRRRSPSTPQAATSRSQGRRGGGKPAAFRNDRHCGRR